MPGCPSRGQRRGAIRRRTEVRELLVREIAGSGISSTLVLDGVAYAGAHGNAILLGAGPPDVEAVASGKALQAKHGVPAAALARAADAGDSSATHALRDAGAALGQAIAFAVNLLDPEVVVLGGGLALGSDVYRSTAQDAMRACVGREGQRDPGPQRHAWPRRGNDRRGTYGSRPTRSHANHGAQVLGAFAAHTGSRIPGLVVRIQPGPLNPCKSH